MSAIPLLLTALTLSEHSLQRPLLLLVKLRLSEVLLHLNSVQQATALVDGVMTMVRCSMVLCSLSVMIGVLHGLIILVLYCHIRY